MLCDHKGESYIKLASVIAFKVDNRQASKSNLDAVLRAKPRNDLDTVRHDCEAVVKPQSSAVVQNRREELFEGMRRW